MNDFRTLLENWHISDFHISDAPSSPESGISEQLSTRGDDVAQVAQFLYEHHPEQVKIILEVMGQRVPGVEPVEARPTEDGRLVLRFIDGAFKDPFIARYVSDGTIKMFAYLVLLHDPTPHPLLAVGPRTSSIQSCSPSLWRSFGTTLVAVARSFSRRTLRTSSTPRASTRSTGSSR